MVALNARQTFSSRAVHSNQIGCHQRLNDIVNKHIQCRYQKPIREHNQRVFEQIKSLHGRNLSTPLIMDSGCGTGMSTIKLARQNPNHIIIGIDQSEKRLTKEKIEVPNNCYFFRANSEDIWRLCVEQGVVFEAHYILYPNPWPKAAHFQRRWHGHPVFPYLSALAPKTIVRSNWLTYLEEFQLAWALLTQSTPRLDKLQVKDPLTLFERKYAGSGQTLFQLIAVSKM